MQIYTCTFVFLSVLKGIVPYVKTFLWLTLKENAIC